MSWVVERIRLRDASCDTLSQWHCHKAVRGERGRSCFRCRQKFLFPQTVSGFARIFRAAHPDAVFANGALGIPTFRTVEGHLFRWNVLPFDSPLSFRIWQSYVHCEMNSKLMFVRFVQTTFVVCAKSLADAEANLKVLLAAVAKLGWKLSVLLLLWTVDFESLDLQTL